MDGALDGVWDLSVGLSEVSAEGSLLGLCSVEGASDGDTVRVGPSVGWLVGLFVDACVGLGLCWEEVGWIVGLFVGAWAGPRVG